MSGASGVQPLPAARVPRLTPRTAADAVEELAALRLASGAWKEDPPWPSATQLAIAKQEDSQAKALTAAYFSSFGRFFTAFSANTGGLR